MLKDPSQKYQPFQPVDLPERQWPSRVIDHAPIWCSVDLRDGNQALIEPMGPARKRRMFDLLVSLGFKQIEIGFPSASQTDFDFARQLVEEGAIPEDVTVQVLTQAREHLIDRTFESLRGVHRAIIHVYNATDPLFRRVVFDTDVRGVTDIAVRAAEHIKARAAEYPETDWVFQYSPELFSTTELEVAKSVCEAVMDVHQPTPDKRLILNLPATVEAASANVYADQIEWFCRNIRDRDSVIISLHPHNDRGTAVAAAELGLMAGADRIEGTLFGNGERTGNVDIVTLALNLYTQGVDPQLSFSDINDIVRCVEYCNQLPVPPRHPYGGELVFTAFSGSHQDAIKKGFAARRQANSPFWAMPYLPIDPQDLGRSYEAVIRVNSQSGKGGVAYLLEQDYGLQLPRLLQVEVANVVQMIADETGKEMTSAQIWEAFCGEYLQLEYPYGFLEYRTKPDTHATEVRQITATISHDGHERIITGRGNGPIDAFLDALAQHCGIDMRVVDYREHAVGSSGHHGDATAVAYLQLQTSQGTTVFGVGMHKNIVTASLRAVISAVNRAHRAQGAGGLDAVQSA
ncbi:MAG: 2-isopropylmalate synthase [Candidatus Competibacterales bacterium]|nr:2-isopropylmalate synthase [Candidatus Competibacterales bacterium]